MSEDASRDQEEPSRASRIWMLLALPGVIGPLFIFGFILFSEAAHDEDDCPYEPVRVRVVNGDARIREERRRCLEAAEERRYTLVRGDHAQVLGRRRFDPAVFAAPGYGWDAGVSDAGEVHMVVNSPGHDTVEFREGRPDER